jgi:hypothetical protein
MGSMSCLGSKHSWHKSSTILVYFSPKLCLKQSYRAKRAEDEPRLDTIRQENVSITSQLIAYKETQTRLLKDIESLKVEKSALVQRKV